MKQERLTRKVYSMYDDSFEYCCNKMADKFDGKELIRANQKLGQLEDIEEELGIDLVKLIECIRNEKGIWKKGLNGNLINTCCMLTCYFGRWQIYDKEIIYDLKDYGKTWALTEGELK